MWEKGQEETWRKTGTEREKKVPFFYFISSEVEFLLRNKLKPMSQDTQYLQKELWH